MAAHGSANTIETDCDCKHYKDSELYALGPPAVVKMNLFVSALGPVCSACRANCCVVVVVGGARPWEQESFSEAVSLL